MPAAHGDPAEGAQPGGAPPETPLRAENLQRRQVREGLTWVGGFHLGGGLTGSPAAPLPCRMFPELSSSDLELGIERGIGLPVPPGERLGELGMGDGELGTGTGAGAAAGPLHTWCLVSPKAWPPVTWTPSCALSSPTPVR